MPQQNKTLGLATVLGSFILWGLLPGFWSFLARVNSVYILAQRIIWSLVFMALYLLVTRGMGEIAAVFRDRRLMGRCFLCGCLITLNWGLYIYAVNSGHVLDASMGYFIEPVLVALIGVIAFRERPSLGERLTLLCAVAGILYLVAGTGRIPVLALTIPLPFTVYGAVKKGLPLSAQASLMMETLLMTPFALVFCGWWIHHCSGQDGVMQGTAVWLLPACGLVTSVPLLLFNMGVKEIPYYVSGILMYINPSLQFLMGLVYFHEEMNPNRLIAFVMIWVGILFTLWEKLKLVRRGRERS